MWVHMNIIITFSCVSCVLTIRPSLDQASRDFFYAPNLFLVDYPQIVCFFQRTFESRLKCVLPKGYVGTMFFQKNHCFKAKR